jgi:hypothetical protein
MLAPVAVAQTFDYPSFASTAGLTLNGSAVASSNQLHITNNASADVGSFWYTTPMPVREGFETRFDFSMTTGSEGMAFVIHGAPTGAATLGGNLWGIGYGFGGNTAPITNSLAIEIDAIQDTFLNDTSANEISVHSVGVLGNSENEGVSMGRVTPVADLSSNVVHTLRIRYVPGVGVSGQLDIFLDAIVVPVLTVAYSFENGGNQLTGGNNGGIGLTGLDAWVGFTSSTPFGQTGQNAIVRSWNWVSYHLPNACYTGNVLAGAGGPYDVLTINGGNGGFFRTVNLVVANPFTVAMGTPPAVPQAPFVLLATVGIADGTTVTTTPWGTACFPLANIVDIGSFLAPYSLAVPAGLVFPIPLTLQGVMAPDPLNPSLVQLTNAIAVQFQFAPAPAITTVAPNSAIAGNPITITGSNFSPFATVDINGNFVTPTTLTATQIVFAMPAGLPCGSMLRVRNPDGSASTANFNPTPLITQQVNTSGPAAGGTTYIAIGSGFAAGTTCTIGGLPATVTNASATVVTVLTPPNPPGPRQIVLTTPGGCTVTSTFTYL